MGCYGKKDRTMASKFILIVKDGGISKRPIVKPQAPRRDVRAWRQWCKESASSARVAHYAFRFGGLWHIYPTVGDAVPLKTFPAEAQAAAEMWLLARCGRAQR